MSSSHRHLKIFLCCLTLSLAFALLSATAGAQTMTVPASEMKAESTSAESVHNPPTAQSVAVKVVNDESGPTNTKTDSAKIESAKVEDVLVEAAVNPSADAPPSKTAAAPSPAPPPTTACKRTITADVVALAQPFMLNRLGATERESRSPIVLVSQTN